MQQSAALMRILPNESEVHLIHPQEQQQEQNTAKSRSLRAKKLDFCRFVWHNDYISYRNCITGTAAWYADQPSRVLKRYRVRPSLRP